MLLSGRLQELETRGQPIRVGLVGAGQMGAYMVQMMRQMQGLQVAAIADIRPENAMRALTPSGLVERTLRTDNLAEAQAAGERIIVTREAGIIPRLDFVDVVIEATGVPEVGALTAYAAILGRKHVVMLSYETVVTVGHILHAMARAAGVVFTGASGDEPAAIMELYEFARSMGFRVVAAGKGKNNPLDRAATPDSVAKDAAGVGTSPRMHCSFVDGSKTMVEMAAVANATGLVPDVRGMRGPRASVDELARVFSLKEQGGILSREGIVDYALGSIAPGVFVVVTTPDPLIREDLAFERMGPGPNYVFLRPYHLCDMETPLSAARAELYGEPALVPAGDPVVEVFAVAKRDLRAAEELDGYGGYTFFGMIDLAETARGERLLPAGLAAGAVVTRPISAGTPITYDMVNLPSASFVVNLRRLQDTLVESGAFREGDRERSGGCGQRDPGDRVERERSCGRRVRST